MKLLSNSGRRSGFTLIELLVVIAIIAILAAILFPVFAQAREKARQADCQSNLKQLGIAFQMYSQDYDETLPAGTQLNFGGNLGAGWGGQLYPYVKSTGVYTCPDDTTSPSDIGDCDGNGLTCSTPTYPWVPISYAYNTLIANSYNTVQGHLAKFTSPANTVELSECTGGVAAVNQPGEGSYVSNLNGPNAGYAYGEFSPAGTGNAFFSGEGNWGNSGQVWGVTGAFAAGGVQETGGLTYYDTSTSQNVVYAPRHSSGSDYLLADGHVKYILAAHVSPGGNTAANATDDAQGCGTGGCGTAAGAAFPGNSTDQPYVATFSPI